MPSNLRRTLDSSFRCCVLQPRELVVYPNLTRYGAIGLNARDAVPIYVFGLATCRHTSKQASSR